MKKEIVILTDLWGLDQADWLSHYREQLSDQFDITIYDSCVLGGVQIDDNMRSGQEDEMPRGRETFGSSEQLDLATFSKDRQEKLHRQFVDFGIEQAAQKLCALEQKSKIYIGGSVGGVIAWRAGLLGLPIEKLIAISATRLRKEEQKPNCPTHLLFGRNDQFNPTLSWFESLKISEFEFLDGGHAIYKEKDIVKKISDLLK